MANTTIKFNEKATRAAFHIFPFRHKKEFKDLTRGQFLKALSAGGIPCMVGYTPLNEMAYLVNVLKTKNYKLMHPPEMLNYKKYMGRNHCPGNARLCEAAVLFS
ncbi:MAG: hypothetical protein ABI416_06300 [Ginsengibacter sp.]